MKIKIHYTLPKGEEDSLVIEADTIEELQVIAKNEVEKRNAKNPWSEKI
jgi:hypothetical protein